VDDAGPLFPASWTSSLRASVASDQGLVQRGSLIARPEFKNQPDMLRGALEASTPCFDRRTEDGVRFRIYQFGSLEVRTTQEVGGEEAVGMVFSVGAGASHYGFVQRRGQGLTEKDRVTKVTEYVERIHGYSRPSRGSYVVLETEAGHSIVTEKLRDGAVAWRENPADLEFRNSLAKVVRSVKCSCATVGDMKKFQITQNARSLDGGASVATCKRYAQLTFCKASGEAPRLTSGFTRRTAIVQPPLRSAFA